MEFRTHRNTTDSDESLYDSAEDLTSDTSDAGENGHQSPNDTPVPDGNRNVPVGERSLEDVNRKIFELFAKPYLDRQTDSQDGVLTIMENIISFDKRGQGNSLYDRVANRIFPLLAQKFQEYFYTFKESPDFKNAVNKEIGSLPGNAVSSFPLQGQTYPQFAFPPPQPGTTFSTPRETSTIGYRHPSTYGSFPGNSQQGPRTFGSLQYPMGLPVPPLPPFQSQFPAPPTFRYLAPLPPAHPPVSYMPLHGSHFRTTMVSQTTEPSQHTEENAMPTFETIEEESNEDLNADLQTLSAKERYQYLGNRLYPKVKDITSANPGKITGMLLELDTETIETLMTSEDELRLKVDEAEQILQTHRDKDKTQ